MGWGVEVGKGEVGLEGGIGGNEAVGRLAGSRDKQGASCLTSPYHLSPLCTSGGEN